MLENKIVALKDSKGRFAIHTVPVKGYQKLFKLRKKYKASIFIENFANSLKD